MTKRVDTTLDADIGLVCGSSGTGKSWYTKDRIKDAPRVAIFDPDDEYSEFPNVVTAKSANEFLNLLARHEKSPLRVRLIRESKQAFDMFSRACFAWGHAVAVAEELAGNGRTTQSKAPAGWHMLLSRGRKRGLSVIGVTQRPSESDKTIVGNASWVHCGRLSRHADRAYMAKELDVDVDEMLMTGQEFIHKKMITGHTVKGDMQRPGVLKTLKNPV